MDYTWDQCLKDKIFLSLWQNKYKFSVVTKIELLAQLILLNLTGGDTVSICFKYSIVAKESVLPISGKKSYSIITTAKTKKW